MNHIAFDLELEQPNTRKETCDSALSEAKIIQLGIAVFTCKPTFEILETDSIFINIGHPLSQFIKKLTKITDEQIAGGVDLYTAFQRLIDLRNKYDCSRVLKQWGGGDQDCLQQELSSNPDLVWPFGYSGLNVKHLYQVYAEANGLNTSGGLKKSLNRCGLQWVGPKAHNAEGDAMNTALIYNFLQKTMERK